MTQFRPKPFPLVAQRGLVRNIIFPISFIRQTDQINLHYKKQTLNTSANVNLFIFNNFAKVSDLLCTLFIRDPPARDVLNYTVLVILHLRVYR